MRKRMMMALVLALALAAPAAARAEAVRADGVEMEIPDGMTWRYYGRGARVEGGGLLMRVLPIGEMKGVPLADAVNHMADVYFSDPFAYERPDREEAMKLRQGFTEHGAYSVDEENGVIHFFGKDEERSIVFYGECPIDKKEIIPAILRTARGKEESK